MRQKIYALLCAVGLHWVMAAEAQTTFSDTNWISMSGFGGANGGSVYAAVTDGSGNLYIGGYFTVVGGVFATNVAEWNGSSWLPLGLGMNSAVGMNSGVYALAVSGGTLYAGGWFTVAGGNAVNHIAQWNGSTWSPLGSGMDGGVYALAMSGDTLYAGGYFTVADGNVVNHIAQWNGSTWSPLASGMNDIVSAVAVSGGTLYAGGYFTVAGGNAANCIAQWNGSTWSPLASGMRGGDIDGPSVSALALSGETLYVGGDFTTAGGIAANYIAQWRASTWSPLDSGMGGFNSLPASVFALAVVGGTLYAGGDFTTAGGNAANYIAQWNGGTWSPLGSGMNGYVAALAVSGGTLYAGGGFTTAGAKVSFYVAEANLVGTQVPLTIITTNAAFGFINGVFGFDVTGMSGSSVVIHASTDLQTWIPLQTNLLGSNGLFYFSDPQSPASVARSYRVQLLP